MSQKMDKLEARVDPDLLARIDKVIAWHERNYSYKYDSRSHFVRCAIIRLLKTEGLEINARSIQKNTQSTARSNK